MMKAAEQRSRVKWRHVRRCDQTRLSQAETRSVAPVVTLKINIQNVGETDRK